MSTFGLIYLAISYNSMVIEICDDKDRISRSSKICQKQRAWIFLRWKNHSQKRILWTECRTYPGKALPIIYTLWVSVWVSDCWMIPGVIRSKHHNLVNCWFRINRGEHIRWELRSNVTGNETVGCLVCRRIVSGELVGSSGLPLKIGDAC